MTLLTGTAPGRICLLGDNADLLEKPAIAAAVSATLVVEVQVREDDLVVLTGADIGFEESFHLGDTVQFDSPLRYVKAVYARFADRLHQGFDLTIHSDIPVSAGLSSSTALCIASIRALQQLAGLNHTVDEIAELSFQIERYDLDVECGRMDQYAIAYGGVTYIQTGDDAGVEPLAISSLPVLVADTQEAHDTQALQKWLRRRIAEDDPSLMGPLGRVVELVEEGREAILKDDLEGLGAIMSAQQALELAMGTSTDRLELLCQAAKEGGAWGAKQMGAGGGGCMIALCPPGRSEAIRRALVGLGAPVWAFDIVPPADPG
jgi:mevalonate kinase